MAYYTRNELDAMGFKRLGKNIKISDKASIYDCEKIEIGDHSQIDDFCVVSGHVVIGRNVHITPQCLIAGGEKGIIFEDFTTVAYQVQIFSQSDDYSGRSMTNSTVPARYKNETKKQVIVGKHSIIGADSVVMPGVHIAEGSSAGAMSLLISSTQPWGVYVGRPAKRLRDRSTDLLALHREYISEYID